jgi:hypothetical protein
VHPPAAVAAQSATRDQKVTVRVQIQRLTPGAWLRRPGSYRHFAGAFITLRC